MLERFWFHSSSLSDYNTRFREALHCEVLRFFYVFLRKKSGKKGWRDGGKDLTLLPDEPAAKTLKKGASEWVSGRCIAACFLGEEGL